MQNVVASRLRNSSEQVVEIRRPEKAAAPATRYRPSGQATGAASHGYAESYPLTAGLPWEEQVAPYPDRAQQPLQTWRDHGIVRRLRQVRSVREHPHAPAGWVRSQAPIGTATAASLTDPPSQTISGASTQSRLSEPRSAHTKDICDQLQELLAVPSPPTDDPKVQEQSDDYAKDEAEPLELV